jgi:hypothetical protein
MRGAVALLLLLVPNSASLADGPAIPAGGQPVSQAVIYELRNLHPHGMTQVQSGGDVLRQYLEFRNEQGSHHVVYEEVSGSPVRSISALRQQVGSLNSICSMDIECTTKAFCLDGCRNMYYEVSNAAADNLSPERDNCRITFFSCEEAAIQGPAPASLPAAAPAAAPPAGYPREN